MRPATGLRFRPPPTAPSDEGAWLLRAAFAARPEPPPRSTDPAEIERLAAAFELGPRIVARHGAETLRRHLGPAAESLVRAHRSAVAASLAADRLAIGVAEAAARGRTPLIFLKGFAIGRSVAAPPGARPYVDLDVLLPVDRAAALARTLESSGFRSLPVPANEQHLAPLVSPVGMQVDLHFCLRGVTLSERWATAEEVLDRQLCRPLPDLPGAASIPSRRLLAAHALAHGIEQHGHRPAGYPLLRIVADLLDLIPEPARWRAALGPAVEWIRASVSAEETAAAFRLAEGLAAGRLPASGLDTSAAVLLSHIVAGTLDARYRASLRLAHTAGRLRLALGQGHLLRYIARKLSPRATRPPAGSDR